MGTADLSSFLIFAFCPLRIPLHTTIIDDNRVIERKLIYDILARLVQFERGWM
jgi:hypothetical protein